MSNLEVFCKVEQAFANQLQSESITKMSLHNASLHSAQDLPLKCKLNQILFKYLLVSQDQQYLAYQNYQQFLNLEEESSQQSMKEQLCYDDCQFLNQEQLNLLQNVDRDEKKEFHSDNCLECLGSAINNQVLLTQEQVNKLIQKQKRQYLREKAKNRKRAAELINIKVKQEEESTDKSIITNIKNEEECQSFSSNQLNSKESFSLTKENSKEQKKQMQQIRNRISAQLSRDKKKVYVQSLEEKQKQLEAMIKKLEEENNALKKNLAIVQTPIIQTKKTFNIPKKEVFKYGFAFFSFMALVCSLNMQSNQSAKQIEVMDQPANETLKSINYITNLNKTLGIQEQQFNEQIQIDQVGNQGLPVVKMEEENEAEQFRNERLEFESKKIKKQYKPRERKIKAIDSK